MDTLVIDAVSKSFGTTRAVDGLSVRVPAGSIYGFLGPNGAGKTTTIRMVMDIIRPDSGRIVLFDNSSAARAKERIGYMPEERGLYPKMAVRKVLAYLGAIKGVDRSTLARAIPSWLDEVGLPDCANKKVEELSRGMQQKLQFVAAVINDPDLLILDEPFSGLDPVNLDLLREIILGLRDGGKTILFSTHMMEQAEQLCDAILLINNGAKVIDGPLADIRTRHQSDVVVLELDGDAAFIGELAMVRGVRQSGQALEVALEDGADSQALLEALVGRVRVRRFEAKAPSLHEIFVQAVGGNDA